MTLLYNEYQVRFPERERQRLRNKKKRYHQRHRERLNEKARKNRAAHPEQRRLYFQKNKERIYEQKRAKYAADKQSINERQRRLHAENPERRNVHTRNYIARKRGNGGRHTLDDINAIFDAQQAKCAYFAYCGNPLIRENRGTHVDHINPLIRGGTNDPHNLQLLCALCNVRKHSRDPIEFARSMGLMT